MNREEPPPPGRPEIHFDTPLWNEDTVQILPDRAQVVTQGWLDGGEEDEDERLPLFQGAVGDDKEGHPPRGLVAAAHQDVYHVGQVVTGAESDAERIQRAVFIARDKKARLVEPKAIERAHVETLLRYSDREADIARLDQQMEQPRSAEEQSVHEKIMTLHFVPWLLTVCRLFVAEDDPLSIQAAMKLAWVVADYLPSSTIEAAAPSLPVSVPHCGNLNRYMDDARLGVLFRDSKCATCLAPRSECISHTAILRVGEIVNPQAMEQLLNTFPVKCQHCPNLLVDTGGMSLTPDRHCRLFNDVPLPWTREDQEQLALLYPRRYGIVRGAEVLTRPPSFEAGAFRDLQRTHTDPTDAEVERAAQQFQLPPELGPAPAVPSDRWEPLPEAFYRLCREGREWSPELLHMYHDWCVHMDAIHAEWERFWIYRMRLQELQSFLTGYAHFVLSSIQSRQAPTRPANRDILSSDDTILLFNKQLYLHLLQLRAWQAEERQHQMGLFNIQTFGGLLHAQNELLLRQNAYRTRIEELELQRRSCAKEGRMETSEALHVAQELRAHRGYLSQSETHLLSVRQFLARGRRFLADAVFARERVTGRPVVRERMRQWLQPFANPFLPPEAAAADPPPANIDPSWTVWVDKTGVGAALALDEAVSEAESVCLHGFYQQQLSKPDPATTHAPSTLLTRDSRCMQAVLKESWKKTQKPGAVPEAPHGMFPCDLLCCGGCGFYQANIRTHPLTRVHLANLPVFCSIPSAMPAAGQFYHNEVSRFLTTTQVTKPEGWTEKVFWASVTTQREEQGLYEYHPLAETPPHAKCAGGKNRPCTLPVTMEVRPDPWDCKYNVGRVDTTVSYLCTKHARADLPRFPRRRLVRSSSLVTTSDHHEAKEEEGDDDAEPAKKAAGKKKGKVRFKKADGEALQTTARARYENVLHRLATARPGETVTLATWRDVLWYRSPPSSSSLPPSICTDLGESLAYEWRVGRFGGYPMVRAEFLDRSLRLPTHLGQFDLDDDVFWDPPLRDRYEWPIEPIHLRSMFLNLSDRDQERLGRHPTRSRMDWSVMQTVPLPCPNRFHLALVPDNNGTTLNTISDAIVVAYKCLVEQCTHLEWLERVLLHFLRSGGFMGPPPVPGEWLQNRSLSPFAEQLRQVHVTIQNWYNRIVDNDKQETPVPSVCVRSSKSPAAAAVAATGLVETPTANAATTAAPPTAMSQTKLGKMVNPLLRPDGVMPYLAPGKGGKKGTGAAAATASAGQSVPLLGLAAPPPTAPKQNQNRGHVWSESASESDSMVAIQCASSTFQNPYSSRYLRIQSLTDSANGKGGRFRRALIIYAGSGTRGVSTTKMGPMCETTLGQSVCRRLPQAVPVMPHATDVLQKFVADTTKSQAALIMQHNQLLQTHLTPPAMGGYRRSMYHLQVNPDLAHGRVFPSVLSVQKSNGDTQMATAFQNHDWASKLEVGDVLRFNTGVELFRPRDAATTRNWRIRVDPASPVTSLVAAGPPSLAPEEAIVDDPPERALNKPLVCDKRPPVVKTMITLAANVGKKGGYIAQSPWIQASKDGDHDGDGAMDCSPQTLPALHSAQTCFSPETLTMRPQCGSETGLIQDAVVMWTRLCIGAPLPWVWFVRLVSTLEDVKAQGSPVQRIVDLRHWSDATFAPTPTPLYTRSPLDTSSNLYNLETCGWDVRDLLLHVLPPGCTYRRWEAASAHLPVRLSTAR